MRGQEMPYVIRARYEGGVLRPLDPLDDVGVREGEVLLVIIDRKSFKGFVEKAREYRVVVDEDVVGEFIRERGR